MNAPMPPLPSSLAHLRVRHRDISDVCDGVVCFSPVKAAWFLAMAGGAVIGGALTASAPAVTDRKSTRLNSSHQR